MIEDEAGIKPGRDVSLDARGRALQCAASECRAAGVGVRASECDRAAALLLEGTSAAHRSRIGAGGRLVKDHRCVVGDAALEAGGRALQRASSDCRAAGVGIRGGEGQRAAARLGEAGGACEDGVDGGGAGGDRDGVIGCGGSGEVDRAAGERVASGFKGEAAEGIHRAAHSHRACCAAEVGGEAGAGVVVGAACAAPRIGAAGSEAAGVCRPAELGV